MFTNFSAFHRSTPSLQPQTDSFQLEARALRQFLTWFAVATTIISLMCATSFGQSEFANGVARQPGSVPDHLEIDAPETTGPEIADTTELNTTPSSNLSAEERLKKLTRKVRREYEGRIVPALDTGDPHSFLLVFADLISRYDPDIVAEIEAIAKSQGYGSLQKKFAQGSIRAIEQGIQVRPKQMADTLIDYLVQGLLGHTELEMSELDQFQGSLEHAPNLTFRETEQQFWEIHVWKNRLANTRRVLGYAVELNRLRLEEAAKGVDLAKIDQLQAPRRELASFETEFQMLRERETELRIAELERSEQILKQPQDFEQALNAAFALEIHGAELAEFFREFPAGKMIKDELKDPALVEKSESLLASGRNAGGSTIEKAVLLRTGAHWWLRGRYGAAALSEGLLKPKVAMQNMALMVGLFMPKDRPKAIGDYIPESDSTTHGYDRRHYFTWAVERKEITASLSHSSESASSSKKIGKDTASTFW